MSSTIRDVAKYAGVGVGTVSRVLNDSTAVSHGTKEKVLEAIHALDYAPNQMARRLSLGKTMSIGIIAPFFTLSSMVERLRGIETALSASDYNMNIFNVETAKQRWHTLIDIPRREGVDGLLVVTLTPNAEETPQLRKTTIPTVLVDAECDAPLTQVVVDDVRGGYKATRHLLERGHRRIAFISHYRNNAMGNGSSRDRFLGYKQALQEAEVTLRQEYVLEGDHVRTAGYQMMGNLLTLPEPPTAVFAASDSHAMGALRAIQHANLQVPRDISIIGYDDIEIAEYLNLTTVRQPLFESGKVGMELLLAEVEGQPAQPTKILLPTEVIVRQTTAVLA